MNRPTMKMIATATLTACVAHVDRGNHRVIKGGSQSKNGPKGTTIYIHKV